MDKSTFRTLLRSVGRDVERLTNPDVYKQTLPVSHAALDRTKISSPFTRYTFNELLAGALTRPNVRLMELHEKKLAVPLKVCHAKAEVHDLTLSKTQQDIFKANRDTDFDQLLLKLNDSGKYKLGIDNLVNYAAQQISDYTSIEHLVANVLSREDLNGKQKVSFLIRLLRYGGDMIKQDGHFPSLDLLVEEVVPIADEALQELILRYYLKRGQSGAFITLMEELLKQNKLPVPDIIVNYIQLVTSQSAPRSARSKKQLAPLASIITRISTPQLVAELASQISTAKEFDSYLNTLKRFPNSHQLINSGFSNLTKSAIRIALKSKVSNAAYASALLSQQVQRLQSMSEKSLYTDADLITSLVQAHVSLGDYARAAKYLRDSEPIPLDQLLRKFVNSSYHSFPKRDTAPGSRIVDKKYFFFEILQPRLREFVHYELFIQALRAFSLDAGAFVEQQKSSFDNTKLKRLQELALDGATK